MKSIGSTLKSVLTRKSDGAEGLVVALVLIAIAVGLCIIFRNSINNIMKSLLNQLEKTINGMANGLVS